MRCRVSVLTDDRLFAEGILRILTAEAACQIDDTTPQVLLVDSRMSGALGLCATLRRDGGPSVLFVAAPSGDEWARLAIEAGARGVLTKSARSEEMLRAVQCVCDGQIWASRRVICATLDHLADSRHQTPTSHLEERLSAREREVFRKAAAGLGNKQLADLLEISEATVKVHLTHIFQKLGLNGRGQLAAAYYGLYDESITPTR